MRQTLFYIPHEFWEIPIFGWGWALGLWGLFSVVLLWVLSRRHGWTAEVLGYLPLLVGVAVALYAVLPMPEVRPPGQDPLGLPIRGYGVFVLAGIVCGVALSHYRALQIGMNPDVIYSLAFRLFITAIVGARLFYVVQKWPEFRRDSVLETVGAILKFTEGGLVVYGAAIGGIVALYFFSRRHQVSMFEVGDVIAPGMALGLAFGRIGCLMNGCCYGGLCEAGPLSITFPQYAAVELGQFSPPYSHQLVYGVLHGMRVGEDETGAVVVREVVSGSSAEQAGLQAGTIIRRLNGVTIDDLNDVQRVLSSGTLQMELVPASGPTITWTVASLPSRSHPVHPSQIYSSINAALLCLVVWFAYPFRRHHGEMLLLLFGLYAITRFLEEKIRDDELGQLGTSLTISQLVSVIVLAVCVATWFWVRRQPPVSAQP